MTDAHGKDGHGHGTNPTDIGKQTIDDILSAVPVADAVAERLGHAHPVVGKEGKVDNQATIDHLLGDGKEVVGSTMPAAKGDHTFLPSWDNVKSTYTSIRDGVKDGHYTNRLKTAMASLYEQVAQNRAIENAIARLQSAPLEASKAAAKLIVEKVGDTQYVAQIKDASSVAEVASYARRSLGKMYQEAREKFQTLGSMKEITPNYALAPAGHGH